MIGVDSFIKLNFLFIVKWQYLCCCFWEPHDWKITDNLLDNFITVMPAPKTHDYIRIRTNMSILNWKKMRYLSIFELIGRKKKKMENRYWCCCIYSDVSKLTVITSAVTTIVKIQLLSLFYVFDLNCFHIFL